MKKLIVFAVAIMSTVTLFSAENAVKNGTFDQLVAGKPASWIVKAKEGVTFSGEGAPESGYVKFDLVKGGKPGAADIWQDITKTVKSQGKYALTFKVRTANFKGNLRIIAINDGWQKGAGLSIGGRFPKDWKEYKKEIVMPEFKKSARLIVMVQAKQGTVEFADIKLEPVEEAK